MATSTALQKDTDNQNLFLNPCPHLCKPNASPVLKKVNPTLSLHQKRCISHAGPMAWDRQIPATSCSEKGFSIPQPTRIERWVSAMPAWGPICYCLYGRGSWVEGGQATCATDIYLRCLKLGQGVAIYKAEGLQNMAAVIHVHVCWRVGVRACQGKLQRAHIRLFWGHLEGHGSELLAASPPPTFAPGDQKALQVFGK